MGNRKQRSKDARMQGKIRDFCFETPRIIGVLSERPVPNRILRNISSRIKKADPSFVCLPFRVERKYLKNVTACMQIMDIEGLIVIGNHARAMQRILKKLDGSAKKARKVNAIIRKKNVFVGYYFDKILDSNVLKKAALRI